MRSESFAKSLLESFFEEQIKSKWSDTLNTSVPSLNFAGGINASSYVLPCVIFASFKGS